jgi:hypothetical protein
VLSWYIDVIVAMVVFLVDLSFILGFILLEFLCERNLSKKGCWFFPPFGVFPG